MATKKSKFRKRWIWSGSRNSRHEHLANEIRPLYTAFSNGLQYPGDHNGPEGEWANCQCRMEILKYEEGGGAPSVQSISPKTFEENLGLLKQQVDDLDLDKTLKKLLADEDLAKTLKAEGKLSKAQVQTVKKTDDSLGKVGKKKQKEVHYGTDDDLLDEFATTEARLTQREVSDLLGPDGYLDNGWLTNSYLREGTKLPAHIKNQVAILDKTMQPLQQNYKVFRGLGDDFDTLYGKSPKVGGTIDDAGFMSTSTHRQIAQDFDFGVMLEIEVPKGARAFWMDSFAAVGEGELILARGSRLRITEILSPKHIKVVVEPKPVKKVAQAATPKPVAKPTKLITAPLVEPLPVTQAAGNVAKVQKAAQGPQIPKGTPEFDAILEYRQFGSQINYNLRQGRKLTVEDRAAIKALEKNMLPLTNEVKVWRGLRSISAEDLNLKPGVIIEDVGFQSTAGWETFAKEWLTRTKGAKGKPGGSLVEITVPKGQRGFSMHRLRPAGEGELVLPRGTRLRITSIDKGTDGIDRIKAEVVKAKAPQPAATPKPATPTIKEVEAALKLEDYNAEFRTLLNRSLTGPEMARRNELIKLMRKEVGDAKPRTSTPPSIKLPKSQPQVKVGDLDQKVRDRYVVKDVETQNRNARLRAGQEPDDFSRQLDDYISRSETTSEGLVHRGGIFPEKFVEDLQVGKSFTDRGYSSLAPDSNVMSSFYADARAFSRAQKGKVGEQKVNFEVVLPRGQKIGIMDDGEWVLPRGAQFDVLGKEYLGAGEWKITVRVAEKVEDVVKPAVKQTPKPAKKMTRPVDDQPARPGDLVEYEGKQYRAFGEQVQSLDSGETLRKLSIGADDGAFITDHLVEVNKLKVVNSKPKLDTTVQLTVDDLIVGDEALYNGQRVKIFGESKKGKLLIEGQLDESGNIASKYVDREDLQALKPVDDLVEGEVINYQGTNWEVVTARDDSYTIVKLTDTTDKTESLIARNDTKIVKLGQEQQDKARELASIELESQAIGESLNFKYGETFLNNPTKANTFASQNYKKWQKSLTEKEIDAIQGYSGPDYIAMNNRLRGLDVEELKDAARVADADEKITHMRAAADRTTTPQDLTTYRAGSVEVPDLKIGDVFVDKGFTSTALDPNQSFFLQELREQGLQVVRIQVPKGSKALPPEMAKGVGAGTETELTLQAGTKFQYLGVDADGLQVIKVINKEADLADFSKRSAFQPAPGKKLTPKEIDDLDLVTPLEPRPINFNMGEFVGAQDSPVNAYMNHSRSKIIDKQSADLVDKYIGAKRELRGIDNVQRRIAENIRGGQALADDDLITQLEWDRLIAQSPEVGRKMTVYRGVGDFEDFARQTNLKVGDNFVDDALSSTTGNREFADYFARVRNGGDPKNTAIFEIEVQASQRGLWTQQYYKKPIQEAVNAQEFVFPRGTQFKVQSITQDAKGQTVVKITVDPTAAKPKELFDLWHKPKTQGTWDEAGEPFLIGDPVYHPDLGVGRITQVSDKNGTISLRWGGGTIESSITDIANLKRVRGWVRDAAQKTESAAAKARIQKRLANVDKTSATVRKEFESKFGDELAKLQEAIEQGQKGTLATEAGATYKNVPFGGDAYESLLAQGWELESLKGTSARMKKLARPSKTKE